MTKQMYRLKYSAVRFLSVFLCVLLFFSFASLQNIHSKATSAPLMYINDRVFSSWQETPAQSIDGVLYIPITMFIELDNSYYFSDPKNGSFYLQNDVSKEYLSFSLKTNDAYNGKVMLKINIQVFNNTMYLPAIETANNLGFYIETSTDGDIVRLSDSSAKMSFHQLVEMYTPAPPPVIPDNPPVVTPPDTPPVTVPPEDIQSPDDPSVIPSVPQDPAKPVIKPCDFYLCFTDPTASMLTSLMTALQNEQLGATFVLSKQYIEENPESVLFITAGGYPIALYSSESYSDFDMLLGEIQSANDALYRICKQKTRLVFYRDMANELKNVGYIPHSFDIVGESLKTSTAVADSVITKFNLFPRARVWMPLSIASISSLYDIGSYKNDHDIINSYSLDETV